MRAAVFLCSPRVGGASDKIGAAFGAGLGFCGIEARLLALRDFKIAPCGGCQPCAAPKPCVMDKGRDQARRLFEILRGADLAVFSSPVYFYAMPAHFKSFIDRGQWQWTLNIPGHKPAFCLQTAGRAKGEKLFEATGRSLAWFLKPFSYNLILNRGWRGMDSVNDISRAAEREARELGSEWGLRLLNENP